MKNLKRFNEINEATPKAGTNANSPVVKNAITDFIEMVKTELGKKISFDKAAAIVSDVTDGYKNLSLVYKIPTDDLKELTESLNERRGNQSGRFGEIIEILGYDDLDDFVQDNPGAVEAIEDWCNTIPEFRKKLRAAEDETEEDYEGSEQEYLDKITSK